RQRCNGRAGVRLRTHQSRQHLVSDQSVGSNSLRTVAKALARPTDVLSSRQLLACAPTAWDRFDPRWRALWRNAPDVCAPADCAWRIDCSSPLVGSPALHHGSTQSATRQPNRLVVVYGFADRFRDRRRSGCRSPSACPDAREYAVRNASRHRGAGATSETRGRGETLVKAFRNLGVFASVAAAFLLGCATPPGQPRTGSQ